MTPQRHLFVTKGAQPRKRQVAASEKPGGAAGRTPGGRAVSGGLLGAGAGAGVGALTGGSAGTGALVGGGLGAAGGALTAPRRY